jgi:RNA polymerase sigma-70 factor (ECF subfamily)
MELREQFASVLDAARTGADWALASLYQGLHPAVLGYLRTRERADAEDLASETWIGVAEGLSRFSGDEADFRRWVFTIARRRLLDHRRRVIRRSTAPASAEVIESAMTPGDAEAEAMTELATEAALSLIGTLPPDQADVVLLRVLGGFDAGDVAAIMGKRAGTIRVLQHRALIRLAGILANEDVTP